MRKINFLLITAFCLTLSACSDYISSKREGLKQFKEDLGEKQAQENKETDQKSE